MLRLAHVDGRSPAPREVLARRVPLGGRTEVEHAALTAAIGVELGIQLSGPGRPYSPDLHIWIAAAQLATYPDVAVVCDPVERHAESPLLVTNPALVVEVLSPSTEDYDRGAKRLAYQQLASLQAYVLVAQDRRHLELWLRTSGDWQHTVYEAGGVARVPQLGVALEVDAIYRRAGVAQ